MPTLPSQIQIELKVNPTESIQSYAKLTEALEGMRQLQAELRQLRAQGFEASELCLQIRGILREARDLALQAHVNP